MVRKQSTDWDRFLVKSLEQLLNRPSLRFSQVTPASLPDTAGVYLITKIEDGTEIPYYIGRTKNMRQRPYNNHLITRRAEFHGLCPWVNEKAAI